MLLAVSAKFWTGCVFIVSKESDRGTLKEQNLEVGKSIFYI